MGDMSDTQEPTASQSWHDYIPIHPAAEIWPMMEPDELQALGEDIKANGMQVPITILNQREKPHFLLLDGRNRLDALEIVGLDVIALIEACRDWKPKPELRVRYVAAPDCNSMLTSHKADPYDYVISVNDRRRHLTAAQRGEVVEKLLKARPDLSDRAIAKTAHVDHTTVANRRRKLEAGGEIHHLETRTGRDGKAQSSTKATTKPKAEPPASAEPETRAAAPPAEPEPPKTKPPAPMPQMSDLARRAAMARAESARKIHADLPPPIIKPSPVERPVQPEAPSENDEQLNHWRLDIRAHVVRAMRALPAADWPDLLAMLHDEITSLEKDGILLTDEEYAAQKIH